MTRKEIRERGRVRSFVRARASRRAHMPQLSPRVVAQIAVGSLLFALLHWFTSVVFVPNAIRVVGSFVEALLSKSGTVT